MTAAERLRAWIAADPERPREEIAPSPTAAAAPSPREEIAAMAARISDEIKARGYHSPPPSTLAVRAAERRIDALGPRLLAGDDFARLDLTDALEAWRLAYLDAAPPRRTP